MLKAREKYLLPPHLPLLARKGKLMQLGFVCSHLACEGGSETQNLCGSAELEITSLYSFAAGTCGFSMRQ